jgi:hypothetical protein
MERAGACPKREYYKVLHFSRLRPHKVKSSMTKIAGENTLAYLVRYVSDKEKKFQNLT